VKDEMRELVDKFPRGYEGETLNIGDGKCDDLV
jgi:hypothetical protein